MANGPLNTIHLSRYRQSKDADYDPHQYNNQAGYGQNNRYNQQAGNPYGQQQQTGNPYAQQQAPNPYAQQDNAQGGGYGVQQQGAYGQTQGNGGYGEKSRHSPRLY